jgi:HD-like signal output (HDOD) protein
MVSEGKDRREAESQVFGYNYADVGAELARRWRFPEVMCEGIANHCDPLASGQIEPIAGIIHLAQFLRKAHQEKMTEEDIIAGFPKAVADAICMDHPRALQEVQETVGVEEGLEALLEGL